MFHIIYEPYIIYLPPKSFNTKISLSTRLVTHVYRNSGTSAQTLANIYQIYIIYLKSRNIKSTLNVLNF